METILFAFAGVVALEEGYGKTAKGAYKVNWGFCKVFVCRAISFSTDGLASLCFFRIEIWKLFPSLLLKVSGLGLVSI